MNDCGHIRAQYQALLVERDALGDRWQAGFETWSADERQDWRTGDRERLHAMNRQMEVLLQEREGLFRCRSFSLIGLIGLTDPPSRSAPHTLAV